MKKALSIILALVMVLAIVAGCGEKTPNEPAGTTDPTGKQIAVCMGSINHPVHRIVQMGFLKKAEELGMKGVVSGLEEGTQQELIAKWESAVTNGAEGLLVWTGDDTCYEMMKSMAEDGVICVVPHFAHDYNETKSFIKKNISCLAATYGKEAANVLVDELTKRGITSGTIGITKNTANVTENAAEDAFRSQIAALETNFKLADTVLEGPELVAATSKVTGVINAYSDIVAGFGTTGGSPQSWAAAMKETGKTDLVVIGMDYTEVNIGHVKNGEIFAVVCQPLFPEAQASAQAIYDIMKGADYAASADTWFEELDAPIAYKGGTGVNDIESYQAIVDEVKTFNFG